MLLLDEPTNNLDADGREAVAQLLDRWRGGAIVASHDRALLERVDRIVELTPVGITVFGGGWPRLPKRAMPPAPAPKPTSSGLPMRCVTPSAPSRRQGRKRRAATGPAAPRAPKAAHPRLSLGAAAAARRKQRRARGPSPTPDRRSHRCAGSGAGPGRNIDTAVDRTAQDGPARQPLTDRLRGCRDGPRRSPPVRPAFIRNPRSGAHRHQRRQRLRQDDAASPDHRRAEAHVRRHPPPDRSHRGARPACRPARSAETSILDNLRRLNPDLSDNEAHAALARFAFRNKAALQIAGTLSGGERLRAGLACVFARPRRRSCCCWTSRPTIST